LLYACGMRTSDQSGSSIMGNHVGESNINSHHPLSCFQLFINYLWTQQTYSGFIHTSAWNVRSRLSTRVWDGTHTYICDVNVCVCLLACMCKLACICVCVCACMQVCRYLAGFIIDLGGQFSGGGQDQSDGVHLTTAISTVLHSHTNLYQLLFKHTTFWMSPLTIFLPTEKTDHFSCGKPATQFIPFAFCKQFGFYTHYAALTQRQIYLVTHRAMRRNNST